MAVGPTEADYIVVGAGSAGCAIAYRLVEAGASVIVVEHGGSDAGPLIQMPGALSYPMNMARYDWGYRTQPEPHLGGRRLACPRGKVVGGSSSINGMVYVRGHAHDFDTWAELGATGWGYADVLPYFRRMETWQGPHPSSWRGQDGPLHVRQAEGRDPLTTAFVEAAQQAGYPFTPDYNGAAQEGVGLGDATIHNGQRWSAASAYLRPAMSSDQCTLMRGLVDRVEIVDGAATGICLTTRGGGTQRLAARREVILSAGAIGSPLILMRSGIGPAAHLAESGIDVVADRPGVGSNLQDHLEVYVQMAASQPVSLFRYWNLIGKAQVGLQWLVSRQGPGASNQFEAFAFLRSRAGIAYPDLQVHFLPIAVRYDGTVAAEGHGYQAHVGPMRSPSRGSVRLGGAGASDPPIIKFNYMSHPTDWESFRTGIRMVREIVNAPALAQLTRHEIAPGRDVQSDDALDDFIRGHAESAYHPCGTCRMGGRHDPAAVVDPQTRVIGVDKLRVADSSIFPQITNGNLNGPSIMVGEKAADHILGKPLLPADNRAPVLAPNWQRAQRSVYGEAQAL
ncbi:MAG: choline dehydrogenase [Pseudomonadota bacterium]